MTAPATMTEAEWQLLLVEYAHLRGWWIYHTHDSRRSQPGWPDLVLLRPPEALFVEVKSASGRVSPEQAEVLQQLMRCDLEVHVWRPADEADAFARLARVPRRPRPVAA